MNKCIGCRRFKYNPDTDEWDCRSPHKPCRKEELEYVEKQRRINELFGRNERIKYVIRNQ